MNISERILFILNEEVMCDDCLSDKSGIRPRQTINKNCRELQKQGFLKRRRSTCPRCRKFKIVNFRLDKNVQDFTSIPPTSIQSEWYWEGNVQEKIVDHLKSKGDKIIRAADTVSREPGVDIEAAYPSGEKLLVTVKGYPKKSQNTQARHWFSQAIFDIVLYKQDYPNTKLAIGLPMGFKTYENLAARVAWLKKSAPFHIYWVRKDGTVLLEE